MKQEKVLTISKQIWILSGIFSILMTVVGLIGYYNAIKLVDQMNAVTNVYMKVSNEVTLIDMFHEGLASKVYKALWFSGQGMNKELEEVKGESIEAVEKVKEIRSVLMSLELNPALHEKVKTAIEPFTQYCALTLEIVDLASTPGGAKAALAKLADFENTFGQLEESLDTMKTSLEAEAGEFFKESDRLSAFAKNLQLGILVLGNIAGLFVAWVFVRGIFGTTSRIVEQLSNGSVKLNEYAQSINDSSNVLAQSTTELASAIEETASSMEEMGAMIAQTTQNAGQTSTQADGSLSDATQGKGVVNKMVHSMRDIAESTERLSSIAKVIEDIKNKTKIINDIAFETRLLAFNASIEAARAGAHGRGFAVVAEEVGKLANVSGKAAEEVRQLLDQSVSQVGSIIETTNKRIEEGEKTTQECEQAFVKMHDSISLIAQGIQRINTAAREQETGVRQANKAIGEMEKVTHTNSRSAEKLSSSADALSKSSEDLMLNASDMQSLVFGTTNRKIHSGVDRGGGQQKGGSTHHQQSKRSKLVRLRETKLVKTGEVSAPQEDPNARKDSEKPDGNTGEGDVKRNDSRWHAA